LALKHGVTVLNSPGTIDSDYRGPIGVILVNHSTEKFKFEAGERIAQIILSKAYQAKIEVVAAVNETERGEGGFGSTGTK
ncbi:MAG TPA: dUTP diphosphatase, partial [Candidatus Glassbacteria bacterium]|nr:dUTP diphosphatase [Candidatus Glassbacteria bacterium]